MYILPKISWTYAQNCTIDIILPQKIFTPEYKLSYPSNVKPVTVLLINIRLLIEDGIVDVR